MATIYIVRRRRADGVAEFLAHSRNWPHPGKGWLENAAWRQADAMTLYPDEAARVIEMYPDAELVEVA